MSSDINKTESVEPTHDDMQSNPAWVTYLSPFRFVVPDDEEPWQVSIDEINNNSFNHGMLCRVVDTAPSPLGKNLPLLVCYDGGLVIPRTQVFEKKENAIDFFNQTLCNLLLGGVQCDAIDTRDVVWGKLHAKNMVWPVDVGKTVASQLHAQLRTRTGGSLNNIQLFKPRILLVSEFHKALKKGADITNAIESLAPKFFLFGVTELRNRNWSSALSNLWIVIEQLTDHIWRNRFLVDPQYQPSNDIPKRKKALKEDNRTWSTSVKHEVLYQNGLISADVLGLIFPARQARNGLVHGGKDVSEQYATAACDSVLKLLECCTGIELEIDESLYRPPHDELREGKRVDTTSDFRLWPSL